MVSFKELKDDASRPLDAPQPFDLAAEVERLRMEVAMAEKGYFLTDEPPEVSQEALLKGFQTPDDFVVKERSMSYLNGDSYEGECLGNLRHGRGTHTCSNGDVYEGSWKYDKRHGKGMMSFKSGLMYEGDWVEDLAQGTGVTQYLDGTIYIGDFAKDQRAGWGTLYYTNGDKYEGEWRDNKITGKGRYTCQDGSYYEGEWAEGERTMGKLVSADGAYEYSGGWADNQRHGYGVMYQRGVCKYMGEWRADVQEGKGKCLYADGSAYDGQWKAGKRHGKGKFNSPALKYDGDWVDDRQEGQGGCQLENGDKYIGEWAAGKQHGRGQCLYGDGSKYEGEWAEGKRHGKGTCIYANGDRYQGEWANDRRHGYGVCKFADGTKFRGDWEDDGWIQSAADPAHCKVAGPGAVRAVAGQEAEFVIQARDEAGQWRLTGGDEFQVQLRGPAALAATVVDRGDGSYGVTYTATAAGVYQLCITIGAEEHVADSPYPLRVLPARPDPRKCEVAGEGRSAASAGEPASFSILPHDQYGNRWFGDGLEQLLPLEVTLEGPGGQAVPVMVEAQREGQQAQYACSYTPAVAGFYRLHVTHKGAPLPRTPFSVQVHAPEEEGGSEGPASGEAASEPAPAPIRDEMKVWEEIAARAYAADGVLEGWDSEDEKENKRTAEEKFIEENPGVAVVENLEDMWVLSKLQRDRKAKEEAEKQNRLQEMRNKLEENFGPAQPPDRQQMAAEVKQIIQEDLLAHDIIQPLKTVASPAASASADSGADAPAAAQEGEVATVAGSGAAAAAGAQAPVAARAAVAPRLLPRSRLKEAAAALEQLD